MNVRLIKLTVDLTFHVETESDGVPPAFENFAWGDALMRGLGRERAREMKIVGYASGRRTLEACSAEEPRADVGRVIKPSDVVRSIPKQVFDVFNELIAAAGGSKEKTVITQDVVVKRILSKMPDVTRAQVFDRGWLNVEDVYRAEGWTVEYDKPAYSDDYEAYFVFSRARG